MVVGRRNGGWVVGMLGGWVVVEMSRIESKSIDQRLTLQFYGPPLNEDLKVVARSLDRPLSRPFPTEKGPVHLLLSLRSGLLPLHAEEECLTPLLFDRQLLLMRVNLSRPTLSIRALDMGGWEALYSIVGER